MIESMQMNPMYVAINQNSGIIYTEDSVSGSKTKHSNDTSVCYLYHAGSIRCQLEKLFVSCMLTSLSNSLTRVSIGKRYYYIAICIVVPYVMD